MTIEMNFFKNPQETVTFSAGDMILEEGNPGDVAYGVVEGTVHIVYQGAVINTINTGEMFGEMALIDNSPRSAAAVAYTDVVLEPVTKNRFKFMVQEHPTFALYVMQVLADRLRKMMGMK